VLTYSRRGSRFTPSQQQSWDAHHLDWVVPDEAVDTADFCLSGIFGREAPLIIEIGSGIGEATAVLAAARPDCNVLALEVWRPGVAHTLGLLAATGAENVRMLSIDAVWFLGQHVEPGSLEELWTFFPDPWPKKRHHKRRLVSPEFARLVSTRLRPGGLGRVCRSDDAGPRCRSGPLRGSGRAVGRPAGHQVRTQGDRGRPRHRRPCLPLTLTSQGSERVGEDQLGVAISCPTAAVA
jgi:tRNA G46 methylase TrmB